VGGFNIASERARSVTSVEQQHVLLVRNDREPERAMRPKSHDTSLLRPLLPPCPRCHRIDQAEEEDQTGSSARWFVCARCGTRYMAPRRLGERQSPTYLSHLFDLEPGFFLFRHIEVERVTMDAADNEVPDRGT